MNFDINSFVLEDIDWESPDVKNELANKKPTAKFSRFSDKLRQTVSQETVCAMFCGGKTCKYCTSDKWQADEMAIDGLYSNWVTPHILAMARPSTKQIQENNLLDKFVSEGIKSIICLQTPNEHGACGQPLEPGGFSYKPEDFMDRNIFFYNYAWPDFGVSSLGAILDIVRVMQFAVSEGKVAIHCHAGRGRTGVLIACYLVFNNRMPPAEVINYVRSKRPKSIQNHPQIEFIYEFSKYLQPFRIIYASMDPDAKNFTLTQFLMRQKRLLHGYEARRLKYIPKIIYVCAERLLELSHKSQNLKLHQKSMDSFAQIRKSLSHVLSPFGSITNASLKTDNISRHSFSVSGDIIEVPDETVKRNASFNTLNNCNGSISDDVDRLSDEDVDESETESHISIDDATSVTSEETDMYLSVIEALTTIEYSEDTIEKVTKYKDLLNTDDTIWQELVEENDAAALCCLMWSWIDELKEPTITDQDINLIMHQCNDPKEALKKFERGANHTTDYLVNMVARLSPLPKEFEDKLLMRIIATLTQQNLSNPLNDVKYTTSTRIMGRDMQRFLLPFFCLLLDQCEANLKAKRSQSVAK